MALNTILQPGETPNGREGTIPVLPATCDLSYLDEGAANIVYRVSVQPTTPGISSIEMYGGGTPPPTELDFEEDPISRVLESKFAFLINFVRLLTFV